VNVFYRFLTFVLMGMFLSACQSLPQPTETDSKVNWLNSADFFEQRSRQAQQQVAWRYSAKVGISAPELREQANLVWTYRDQANDVRLFGPLGIGAVKLQFDEFGIPIEALRSWIFVLPDNGSAFRYQLDENQQVMVLEQLGWSIEYSSYREYGGRLMPRKIVARKILPRQNAAPNAEQIVVKLITKNWK